MVMTASPDLIFELVLPSPPSAAETAAIGSFVQGALPFQFQVSESVFNTSNSVLSVGFWLANDGSTTTQLQDSLRASSFISGGMTVDLFVSKAAIQQRADQVWANEPKNQAVEGGHITLNNNISVDVTGSGIVTTVGGGYHVEVFHHQVLPTVGFTYTITDTLAIQAGVLQLSNESTHVQLSQSGIIVDSLIISLLSPILGVIAFFGAELGGGLADPHRQGVGAQLAGDWPSTVLTPNAPPLTGKVIFTWSQLNMVSGRGISTLGTWSLAARSPQVQIAGPKSLSFAKSQPGATGFYTAELTDLQGDGATVVWGGAADGGNLTTRVDFDSGGFFSIRVSVTDVDNISATAATIVQVTELRKGGGETP
jgi:hypothetical protein